MGDSPPRRLWPGHPIFPLDACVRCAGYFISTRGRGLTALGGLVRGGRAGACRACGAAGDVLVTPPQSIIKVMRDTKNKLSRKDVIAKMRTLMRGHFAQNPQLEGNTTNRAQAIAY